MRTKSLRRNDEAESGAAVSSTPLLGQLQVWWIPQVPGKPFTVDVANIREAKLLLKALADYDLFQYENRIKPDYCNADEDGNDIDDARIEKLRARQNAIRLERIEQLLQDAGVPKWVQTIETGPVPSNAPDYRLQWFLARRKNVKPAEIDQRLQKEMADWMRILSQRHNDKLTDERP